MKTTIIILITLVTFVAKPNKVNAALLSCDVPHDIAIVLDNSCSVGDPKNPEEWTDLIAFAYAFIDLLNISDMYAHVSIIMYDGFIDKTKTEAPYYPVPYAYTINDSKVEISLSHKYSDLDNELNSIKINRKSVRNSDMTCGSTNTASGIERAHQDLKANGRADVDDIIIVITDGVSNFGRDPYPDNAKPVEVARSAKADDVTIYPIIVGYNKDSIGEWGMKVADQEIPRLTGIVGKNGWDPSLVELDRDWFKITNFSSFHDIVNQIISYECGFEGLYVDGFVVVDNKINNNRRMQVSSFYSIFDNVTLLDILKRFSVGEYWVEFD